MNHFKVNCSVLPFFPMSVGHLNPYRRCSAAFYFFHFPLLQSFWCVVEREACCSVYSFLLPLGCERWCVTLLPRVRRPRRGWHWGPSWGPSSTCPAITATCASVTCWDGRPSSATCSSSPTSWDRYSKSVQTNDKREGGEPFLQNHRKYSKLEMLFVFSDILKSFKFLFVFLSVCCFPFIFFLLPDSRSWVPVFKGFLFSEVVYLNITYI